MNFSFVVPSGTLLTLNSLADTVKDDYHRMVNIRKLPVQDWYTADCDKLKEIEKNINAIHGCNEVSDHKITVSMRKLLGDEICDEITAMGVDVHDIPAHNSEA